MLTKLSTPIFSLVITNGFATCHQRQLQIFHFFPHFSIFVQGSFHLKHTDEHSVVQNAGICVISFLSLLPSLFYGFHYMTPITLYNDECHDSGRYRKLQFIGNALRHKAKHNQLKFALHCYHSFASILGYYYSRQKSRSAGFKRNHTLISFIVGSIFDREKCSHIRY